MADSQSVVRARGAEAETILAAVTGVLVGVRFPVMLNLPILAFVLALLPLSLGAWASFRGARVVSLTAFAAAASGVLISVIDSTHVTDGPLLRADTARVLILGAGTLALLWARSVVGTRLVLLGYGAGTFVTVALGFAPVNPDNPWKFSYAIPAILVLLSLKQVHRRLFVEFGVLLVLAAISVLNDSRSLAAMLIIAAAVRFVVRPSADGRSSVRVAVGVALISVSGFYLVQAMIAEGMLGEAAQLRTEQQTEVGGNVLLGGRPEAGASAALVARSPWGYGAGAIPTPTDVRTAKLGMSSLGYDPDNGYVERYMFGYGFEVHSLVGDLWIRYGPVGLVLACACLMLVAHGMIDALRRGAASGVMVFLAVRTIWDFAFSPFETVMTTLLIALAVTLPPSRPQSQSDDLDVAPERRRTPQHAPHP